MLLKYFYDEKLSQASYLLGCPQGGTALVVDPAREISPYLQAAQQNDLMITGVVETHIHADYVSGGHELAQRTGAVLYLSGMGEGDLAYDLPGDVQIQYLYDGDHIMIGGIRIDVLHTPGHTPEHIILQVTDTGADHPIGLFTGDCLFVGDVGRPDLLEEAVKIAGTKEQGARQQYANVQRLKTMPDYMQVWPGHGAGSACGKALGAIPSTTIGYEKLFNPAFNQPDEATFIRWLLDGQPEPPRYFAQMKQVNRVGAARLNTLQPPRKRDETTLLNVIQEGHGLVIDARQSPDFTIWHIPGTLYVPGSEDHFSTWVGWYVNYDEPVYLIAEESDIPRLVSELRAIGVDDIPGYFTPDTIEAHEHLIQSVNVQTAAQMQSNGIVILDVRGKIEREERYIPGSMFIPMGLIPERIDDIPREHPLIVHCGGGRRSQVVASLLDNHGYAVSNMAGGIDAWIRAGLPFVSS